MIAHALRKRELRGLVRDRRGATTLEFGLIAPSLCAMLLGALDFGHALYMQSVLQGAVQKAAREGTLETATGTTPTTRNTIDAAVKNQLWTLNKTATIEVDRRFFRSFTEAAAKRAETFTDTNGDGICNGGEPFEDRNNNGVLDKDGGDSADRAGARDNIVYVVKIHYPRMFPIDKLLGGDGTTTLVASTVLANQPFGNQGSYGAATLGHCNT